MAKTYTEDDLVTFAVAMSRDMLAREFGQKAYGQDRDYYETLGYNEKPTFTDYLGRYKRQDIAARIVDLPAQDTWKRPPAITEEGNEDTEFVKAWETLADRLHVWSMLSRADRLSGIGQYGVLLIGVKGQDDDGNPLALSEPIEKASLQTEQDVLYLRPFSEGKVGISTWESDTGSGRYGLPELYSIKLKDDMGDTKVHWTRVLHLADGKLDSEVYGTPRLELAYNRLDDLIKIVGGAAEAAWLQMRPGTLFTNQPGYAIPQDADAKADRLEEIRQYAHDVLRVMFMEGIDAQQIGASEVPAIGPLFDCYIALLAAASGIPQRVLIGSAQGELSAAKEDMRQWAGNIAERQTNYAEPEILRPFIDRLTWYGALPTPADGYTIGTQTQDGSWRWPPLVEMTEGELAEITKSRATAIKLLADPMTGELPIDGEEARELLGYQDDDERQAEVEEPPDEETEDAFDLATHASHAPIVVNRTCPLCGADTAYRYDGHGPLLVCAGCGKTYNPEVE